MFLGEKGCGFVVFGDGVMGFDFVNDFWDCLWRDYREEFGCGLLMLEGFGHAPDYQDGKNMDSTGDFKRQPQADSHDYVCKGRCNQCHCVRD